MNTSAGKTCNEPGSKFQDRHALEAGRVMSEQWYRFAWKNNAKRAVLHNRKCRIVARLAMNSAVVEFEGGQRECISRNALKKCVGRR